MFQVKEVQVAEEVLKLELVVAWLLPSKHHCRLEL